jgi:hypothetical protein
MPAGLPDIAGREAAAADFGALGSTELADVIPVEAAPWREGMDSW